jgi:2-iminobutanoate/2-iminopropanoate deaminase
MTEQQGPPLSRFRRAGDFIFVSGQLPRGADGKLLKGGIEAQTEQALHNLREALADAGAGLDDVVKVSVWLTAADKFDGFNAAYRRAFSEPFPARSTVVSALVVEADVEIEAVAYKPSSN